MMKEPAGLRASAERRMIYLELTDGRMIAFPAARFQRLKAATDEQLKAVTVEVNGYALGGVGRRYYCSKGGRWQLPTAALIDLAGPSPLPLF